MSARYEVCKRIVERHQYEELEGSIMDAQTAQLLVQVYERLSPSSQARFDSIPLPRLVKWAWSLV